MRNQFPFNVSQQNAVTRRDFLKQTSLAAAGVAAIAQFPFVTTSHAAPDGVVNIGVIGCGGRGTGAALDALGAATNVIYPKSGYHTEDAAGNSVATQKNVKIMALADIFPDRLDRCRKQLAKINMEIPEEACFTGFDAYKKLLAIPDINYVILATPPHFRPLHLRAAIEAGKNVFIEKPVAVDGVGVRSVIESSELAKQKGLGISAGTQRRHQKSYIETIKRIQDGAIGEILSARCYWNGGVIWVINRDNSWTDMEWQLRHWNYFTWLGGDHIVEQHVHNLDIMYWIFGKLPVKAYAMGGRQARPNKNFGHIYDHFSVEYEYEDGLRMFSFCRQMDNCTDRVEEGIVGTKGTSDCHNRLQVKGGPSWRFSGSEGNPYRQEHIDLIESVRAGKPINEARTIAESTLMGIMGRESAYSGKLVERDAILNSNVRLGPDKYQFGDLPFPDVAIPGQYRLG